MGDLQKKEKKRVRMTIQKGKMVEDTQGYSHQDKIDTREVQQSISLSSGIGISILIWIGAGMWIGKAIDQYLGSGHIATLVGLGIGMGIGIFQIFLLLNRH